MKKICCSNESLCDYFFNRVLWHGAFSGPLHVILFLSILIYVIVFHLIRKMLGNDLKNHKTTVLIRSCHKSSQGCMGGEQGQSIFQGKS